MHYRNHMVLALLLTAGGARAQTKRTEHVGQTWLGYFNQARLSDRWGLWLEAQGRTRERGVEGLSQGIARLGLTYYLNDATKATAGYAFVNHFPADNHMEISQPEHRLWQQLQWHTKYGRLRTMQWFRLEERYRRRILNDSTLGSGFNFNLRARYNFLLQVPLAAEVKQGSLSVIANNEIHINFGKAIVNNYFDQNRFFLGFAYHVNAHDNLQFGYLNIFQQLAAGNRYKATHAARIYFFHNLDLRKKRS
ncbi:DUF2490 domain-containing protein [Flaviaesturariibacter amylovorans]|uniref:DUF2490 domain-containing protein n=1 Tax=Flaviaesturariibacter amylovorans TaxID=1084520 RepID=A0ABP8H0F6_9BACT